VIILLLITIAVLEVVAFALYAHDKAQARGGGRRVPERTLLLAALWGGAGAWLACGLLRHKTRKQPFRRLMNGAVVLHLIGVATAVWGLTR
jgi:uncharacterized membrane protein YsdA (DUF1294 family)